MKVIGVFQPSMKFKIHEGVQSEVDGKHIIAKVSGECFVPDGISRNGRFYPRNLWEKVIANQTIQQKLKDKLMFGTIGHDAELGDKALREGIASHIITSINIDEHGKGMCDFLVLNTDAGRNLNTLLRAGCKLFTSSRADGSFKGEYEGMPRVDEDSYDLQGWDFVIEAGFTQARPELTEALNNINKIYEDKNLKTRSNSMNEELKKMLETLNVDLAEGKILISTLTKENKALKEELEDVSKENDELKNSKSEAEEQAEKDAKELADYKALGSTPEKVKEALELADKATAELEKFEAVADSAEEVEKGAELAEKLSKDVIALGGLKVIKESLSVLAEYKKLGTPAKVSEALSFAEKEFSNIETKVNEARTAKLSKEIGLSIDETKKLLEKYSIADVKKLYESVAKKKKVNEEEEVTKKEDEVEVKEEEDKDAFKLATDKKDEDDSEFSLKKEEEDDGQPFTLTKANESLAERIGRKYRV